MTPRNGRLSTLLVALVLLGDCTQDPAPGNAAQTRDLSWQRVDTSLDREDAILADGDDLLVAGNDAAGLPALRRLTRDDTLRVPVTPLSYYGVATLWSGLALSSGELLGFGGARGGAHGNKRWTVFSQTPQGALREDVQTFETFGGWGVGGLVDLVPVGGAPVLVGSWASEDAPGLDIALWRLHGDTWTRDESGGTALAGTRAEQVSVRGADLRGAGLVIEGAVSDFAGDTVALRPAVWLSADGRSGWTRTTLPADGAVSEATGAACTGQECLVVGRVDGRLAAWSLGEDDEVRTVELPDTELAEDAVVPSPVALDDGRFAVAVPAEDGARVLLGDADDWEVSAGPPGLVTGLAVTDDRVWALSQDADRRGRLYSSVRASSSGRRRRRSPSR